MAARRMRYPAGEPKKKNPGGRPAGSQTKDGSVRTTAEIRKAARESGLLPMEILLEAGRTGKLPRYTKKNGKYFGKFDSRELDSGVQLECLKTVMNYFHGKVNPINEEDMDYSSSQQMLLTFIQRDRIALLSEDQLKQFEQMLAILAGDDAGRAVIDQQKLFAEMKGKMQSLSPDAEDYAQMIDITPEEVTEDTSDEPANESSLLEAEAVEVVKPKRRKTKKKATKKKIKRKRLNGAG